MNVLIAMVSFASQWFTCLVVAAVLLAVLYCYLKQLAENGDAAEQEPIRRQDETGRESENEPILPRKEVFFSYGATEEQPESSACPAEDPLSEKMCKICYDAPRSCFLIPCGHCFTCFTCATCV